MFGASGMEIRRRGVGRGQGERGAGFPLRERLRSSSLTGATRVGRRLHWRRLKAFEFVKARRPNARPAKGQALLNIAMSP